MTRNGIAATTMVMTVATLSMKAPRAPVRASARGAKTPRETAFGWLE